MLEIQKQLRSGKTPQEICEPLGIDFKELDGKVLFSYDMISSYKHKNDPIVKECRGLILYKNNWDVASYAFNRFFNYGETGADILPVDLSGCMVLEKLDGSMMTLRYDKFTCMWEVSTRNMMYAEGPVNNCTDKTFAKLFWEAAKKTNLYGMVLTGLLSQDNCYVFELTGPENRIVTPYKESKITLLTTRNLKNLEEASRSELIPLAKEIRCDLVKEISMSNWEELLKMEVESVFEGYVVVKEQGGSHLRVKVKNTAYLSISKLVSSISERGFLELIKLGKHDDYLSYFPEYKEHIQKLLDGIAKISDILRKDWYEMPNLSLNKDYKQNRAVFAKAATQRSFPQLLFMLYDGKKVDILELKTDSLLDMIHKVEK